MALANEDRGGLVGAFIVEDGDEILSITTGGQVVRSPINAEFRPTGRSTQGVKFVSFRKGDAVAVVTRSVESKAEDELEEGADGAPAGESTETAPVAADATIEAQGASEAASDDDAGATTPEDLD